MTTVSLVGSTGSIGTQAMEVVNSDPDRYQVVAIGAARSVEVAPRKVPPPPTHETTLSASTELFAGSKASF